MTLVVGMVGYKHGNDARTLLFHHFVVFDDLLANFVQILGILGMQARLRAFSSFEICPPPRFQNAQRRQRQKPRDKQRYGIYKSKCEVLHSGPSQHFTQEKQYELCQCYD